MDDIVAIKAIDKKNGECGFITWGRLFDRIDDTELLNVIKKHASRWGINDLESIELCYSLMEIAHLPYFYECLIRIIQEPIPFNKYDSWKKKKIKALQEGHDIYFTGFLSVYHEYLERKKLGFPDEYE